MVLGIVWWWRRRRQDEVPARTQLLAQLDRLPPVIRNGEVSSVGGCGEGLDAGNAGCPACDAGAFSHDRLMTPDRSQTAKILPMPSALDRLERFRERIERRASTPRW